jgi:hypothetical protein
MKFTVFLFSWVFMFNSTIGQTIGENNIISEIVTVDSAIIKSTLFSNGLAWFAYQFKSANDVIQMKDSDAGKIIGKGFVKHVDNNGKLEPRNLLITLSVKNGKYKYEIEIEYMAKEYQIEMEATCFNCGKTTARVTYNNNSAQISNIIGGKGFYLYDNENVSWLEKGNYKKWKTAVDKELIDIKTKIETDRVEYSKNRQLKDLEELMPLINSLKNEMIRINNDF